MKRKLLLAFCALLIGWSNASAQTDVTTTYITNPSFETDAKDVITPTGWTISGTAGTKKVVDADSEIGDGYGIVTTLTDGTKGYGIRQAWAEADFSIYQSVTLPAGFYVLKVDEKSVYAAETSSKTPSFKLYAGDTESENFAFTTQLVNSTSFFPSPSYDFSTKSLSFYSDGSEVNIGVSISFMDKRNDVLLDNFKLYSYPAATSSDYAALKDALDAVGEKNCGFESGEYAPYTNKEAFEALAAAKAINPSVSNKQSTVQEATAALTSAIWAPNATEVNAIRWIYGDYTDDADKQVPLGWTNGDGNDIRISANHTTNSGLEQLNQYMCLNINIATAAIYGETEGYTMPLKGNTVYKLTFSYAGWGNTSGTPTIIVTDGNGTEVKNVELATSSIQGNNTTAPWTAATIVFQTNDAGNYKLSVSKTGNRTAFGDFMLKKAGNVTITPANAKSTYVTTVPLDFTDVEGLDAYVATEAASGEVRLEEVGAVPAGTPLMLIGTASTEYTVPVVASASAPAVNMFVAGDGTTEFNGSTYDYILYSDGKFYQIGSGTVATNKAYLHCDSDPTSDGNAARGLRISFGDITGVANVEAASEAEVKDGKFFKNGKLVIFKNGKKFNANGVQVK